MSYDDKYKSYEEILAGVLEESWVQSQRYNHTLRGLSGITGTAGTLAPDPEPFLFDLGLKHGDLVFNKVRGTTYLVYADQFMDLETGHFYKLSIHDKSAFAVVGNMAEFAAKLRKTNES